MSSDPAQLNDAELLTALDIIEAERDALERQYIAIKVKQRLRIKDRENACKK